MKQGLQLRLSQQLAMTPQLQQAIRLRGCLLRPRSFLNLDAVGINAVALAVDHQRNDDRAHRVARKIADGIDESQAWRAHGQWRNRRGFVIDRAFVPRRPPCRRQCRRRWYAGRICLSRSALPAWPLPRVRDRHGPCGKQHPLFAASVSTSALSRSPSTGVMPRALTAAARSWLRTRPETLWPAAIRRSASVPPI